MRIAHLLLLGLFLPGQARSQGSLVFLNTVPTVGITAPITFANGTRIPGSAGYTAQLFVGPLGTPVDSLEPLFPTTIFRDDFPGFLVQANVPVPNLMPGDFASTVVRVFDGSTWDSSSCRGESPVFESHIGGPQGSPSGFLIGLRAFSLPCVPEPSSGCLAALGALLMLGNLWRACGHHPGGFPRRGSPRLRPDRP